MRDFLPYAVPDVGEEEIAEVVESLRSGWLTTGPKTKRFEADFAEFMGPGIEAIAVNSATAGLHLALEAIGVGPDTEVITTTYTFTATAEVVRYLGAHPVFVDIDPATLNMDVAQVEAAITPRTRAIVPVHVAGLACDMDAILAVAKKHGLRVVEDAAHAFPATWGGKLIGALDSDVTVFSFYATKTLVTGEGGMVVTRDHKIAKRCRVMRLHGIDRDAFDRYTSTRPSWYYEVVAPGFKYNMTDIAAALGIHQLKKAYQMQQVRRCMAEQYDAAFADLPVALPPRHTGDMHAWHLYVLRIGAEAAVTRDVFIQEMSRRGIGTSVHFIPLHLHPYWRDTYNLERDRYPLAVTAYEAAVSLPIYPRMQDEQVVRVMTTARDILLNGARK
ncbi:MAG: DegT/DnrJ/EryC1/StrS family aminotransferase [Armatimonadetes bacterium]|nr:DegT/DnrJ/EryC1/StrS family aminotransferase [Armatimonadota bacterium]